MSNFKPICLAFTGISRGADQEAQEEIVNGTEVLEVADLVVVEEEVEVSGVDLVVAAVEEGDNKGRHCGNPAGMSASLYDLKRTSTLSFHRCPQGLRYVA